MSLVRAATITARAVTNPSTRRKAGTVRGAMITVVVAAVVAADEDCTRAPVAAAPAAKNASAR